ncbi:MAG: phosphopantetheine-binding protein [Polaromonas sp.]|nr:phosphopantetheine-binding protein [Polaromonas sp.]
MTTTFDRLCAILAKDYKLQPEQLRPDAPLQALGIDSLGVADLLFNVEDEFGVRLPPEPVQVQTIGDVAAFIDRLMAAQQVSPAQPTPAGPPAAVAVPAAPLP